MANYSILFVISWARYRCLVRHWVVPTLCWAQSWMVEHIKYCSLHPRSLLIKYLFLVFRLILITVLCLPLV